MREELWQEIECDRCRRGLFVLPRNVYPRPVGTSAENGQSLRAGDGPVQVLRAYGRDFARGARSLPVRAVRLARRPVDRVRAKLTRFRLVILGATAVVLATAWWGWGIHARQQAALTLVRAVERGEQALAGGDLAAAAVEFRKAAQALDTLGRKDPQATGLRQLDRECHAATHLATASIYDMLESAQRALSKNPSAHWQEDFKVAYGGRWVIFDTTIQRQPGTGEPGRYIVEYPLTVGGLPVVIDAPLSAFDRLDGSTASRPAIFAARIRGATIEGPGDQKRWIVSLDGTTGFLWTRYETYRGLGLGPDDIRTEQQIQALLAEQSGGTESRKPIARAR